MVTGRGREAYLLDGLLEQLQLGDVALILLSHWLSLLLGGRGALGGRLGGDSIFRSL